MSGASGNWRWTNNCFHLLAIITTQRLFTTVRWISKVAIAYISYNEITKYSNILVREELSHEEDCFAVRSYSLCRRRLRPGCARRARQEGGACSGKSYPERQRYAYSGS